MRQAVDGATVLEQPLETSPRELGRTVGGLWLRCARFKKG